MYNSKTFLPLQNIGKTFTEFYIVSHCKSYRNLNGIYIIFQSLLHYYSLVLLTVVVKFTLKHVTNVEVRLFV